jgi:hypothetical protein
VLFLLRPRQTWLPYGLPRSPQEQEAYNRLLRDAYASTRRVPAPAPEVASTSPRRDPLDALAQLGELHESGVLTDAEFAAAKARVLGSEDDPA